MSSGIYDIFEELREDNSTNYKIETLKKYTDNELLKRVLDYTYSPFKQYYIKQLPGIVSELNETGSYISLEAGLEFVDKLANREITGNDARQQVAYTVDHMHPDDAKVLLCVLDRSIDCGISEKGINKVFKKLIPEVPYMRCEKLTDKTKANIKYPAIVQLKADGTFLNIVKHNKTVKCLTRNGTEFYVNKIQTYFEHILTDVDDIVITGEAVLYKDGKVLERKIGNGMINSFIKREATRESALDKQKELVKKGKGNTKAFTKIGDDLHAKEQEWAETEEMFTVEGWDLIDYKDWTEGLSKEPYNERFEKFKGIATKCDFLDIIPTTDVSNFEEAQAFANDMMNKGLEGGVLKNLHAPWENKTSKNQIKLKAELDADLRVVGYVMGTGDFELGIGALICETIDGLLNVSVGSGFKRDERGLERVDENDMTKGLRLRSDLTSIQSFYEETYHNKIVAVKYNEVIKSEGKDTYSLFLPIFTDVRFDKDTADDIKRLGVK